MVSVQCCQLHLLRLDFAMVMTYACEYGAADAQGVKRIFHNEDIFLCLAYLRLTRLMRRDEDMSGESSLVVPNSPYIRRFRKSRSMVFDASTIFSGRRYALARNRLTIELYEARFHLIYHETIHNRTNQFNNRTRCTIIRAKSQLSSLHHE